MIEELKEHKSLLIALIVVLLLAAGGIMFLQGTRKGTSIQTGKKNSVTPSSNEVVKGRLSIEPMTGRQIYEVGESITLLLRGNSDGKDAVGFDAAVKVNQDVMTFSQVKSLLTTFETFSNVNAERVYIGGIRKLDSKNATVLDNTDLAEVTFKARSEGHSNVDFLFKPDDTTESNIVLTSSKDGLGDVKGTDIYVGKKVALTTDSAVVVPSVNFRLTLKNITTESAQIDIALGNQTDTKKFTWGVGGTVSKNIETFSGFMFQVEKTSPNGVTVYYGR
jgi:ferredoxin-fold anticodon binding domain-containing protein